MITLFQVRKWPSFAPYRIDLARRAFASVLLIAAPLILPATLPASHASVIEAWVRRSSEMVNDANGQASRMVRDATGNVIVAGYANDGVVGKDMLTIKYSGADGSVLWQQRYNGPANGDDRATAVALDGDGNVVVTGSSRSSNTYDDRYVAKYAAANGAPLWEQRLAAGGWETASAVVVDRNGNVVVTGLGSTSKYAAADGTLLWEVPDYGGTTAIAVDGSGNVLVTGSHTIWPNPPCGWGNCRYYAYYTAKYASANGALLWEVRADAMRGAGDLAVGIVVDASGNAIVTGRSASPEGGYDFYTAKYAAASGALLWAKRYNGPASHNDVAAALALDRSGNVVVTGYSNGTTNDFYTAKYAAANGALLWEKRYDGTNGTDQAQSVALDTNGNVIVTGFSRNSNGDDDYYTAKYAAANGVLLWERRGPFRGSGGASAVVVDASGDVVVTGAGHYTAKYAATNGALRWEQFLLPPANLADHASAVAVDGSGNVVVTGHSRASLSGWDYYTAKYAAVNGTLLWERRFNGPANRNDYAVAVAVAGGGDVVVTGSSQSGDSNSDFYTAKYAAADGALLWEQRYNGPANGDDVVRAMTVDRNGNVVVTGFSQFSQDGVLNSDYCTVKYAAADGALLWERRYNSPSNGYDEAVAVAVDGSGNVVVTGYADGDYYTAKYGAADGALLWGKRYNSAANGYDEVRAAAVDGSGNPVVTGYSDGNYYTAKYAAADGALLWENRHIGPVGGGDGATAVAVDRSGNVIVTGSAASHVDTTTGVRNYDYYTAKYAAADGTLLWENWNDGPAHGHDEALAVAVDVRGDVLVTGNSYNNQLDSDYYTAKYAATDGSLLWEKRYKSAGQEPDYVSRHALALGPNGMVAVTGSGSFYYVASDLKTVVYRDLPVISVERSLDGVRLRCFGDAGSVHQLWRSPGVAVKGTLIHQQAMPAVGFFEFTDTSELPGAAFYHLLIP